MTKEELIETLKDLKKDYDPASAHIRADEALLKFINDEDIKKAFQNIEKWYA